MNYYRILNVASTSTKQEIKVAYKKKAKECHPDLGGDEELFKQINEAYSVLYDDEKRRVYDYKFSNRTQYTKRSLTINHHINITMRDAYFGLRKTIRVEGELIDIEVPRGFMGKSIIYKDMGKRNDGIVGDLIIHINVLEDENVSIVGMCDIETKCDIDFVDYIKRSQITLKLWNEDICKITIPDKINTRDKIRIQGVGMSSSVTDYTGDLFVTFNIVNTPNYNNMTDRQKESFDNFLKEINA
jgi:DnaJ-class molecular chaperone